MASIFDEHLLTKSDIKRINELGKLWQEAKDEKSRSAYHNEAEAIRQSYGYSGGEDGHGFEALNNNVVNTSAASNAYSDALRQAQQSQLENYKIQSDAAEADGKERLRQAYIKNMQQSLGLDQAMKAEGITGGMSESTRAALNNRYSSLRDSILSDVASQKQQIALENNKSSAQNEKDIAENEYKAALTRAEQLENAKAQAFKQEMEQKQYELDKNKAQKQYELDLEKFDYQKQKDELDREYEKLRDELNRQNELKKVYASKTSKSTSSSSSSSSSKSSDNSNEQLKKEVWKLLEKGVYHESFPEILGFSEDVLLAYADNILSGF